YPEGRSTLAPLRVTYIFAGPRETVLHTLIMKNYGCTHALIGRDHAGIGDFYDKYESHNIFEQFTPEELGIDVRLYREVFYCTRCDSLSTGHTCPHDERFHINISGTGIREMLRQGILPPKEIVRPESARIAMQGVQPKGLDENNESISPVGNTIKSIFPFYLKTSRLGGPQRKTPLEVEELSIRDLEAVMMDGRAHAHNIYEGRADEVRYLTDITRCIQREWISDTRDAVHSQHQKVIENVEEKVEQATEKASDEFMYQDKEGAKQGLEVSRKILNETP